MKKVELNDATLVSLYIRGDESAFEKLVRKHKTKIFNTIYLIVKDRYTAEDLMQDTFVKIVDTIKGGRYNEEGKFLPWAVRIAHNLAIDHFRRERRYPVIVMEDGSPVFDTIDFTQSSFENEKIRQETKANLRKLITQLPEAQREVLLLRHFAGLSFQEIADQTGVSINTALGRMRYALINLRKKLDKQNFVYDKDLWPK